MSAGHGGLMRAVRGRKVGRARTVAWCACGAEHGLHDPIPLPHSLFSISGKAGERKQEERDDTAGASCRRHEVAAACWAGPCTGEHEHARRPGWHLAGPARLSKSAVGAVERGRLAGCAARGGIRVARWKRAGSGAGLNGFLLFPGYSN
jgi:hypothetical protein